MEVSENDFNKCISPVASLLPRFDFKPLQTLCLRTFSVRTGRFSLSSHRLWEKFSVPVLAVFVSLLAVGQGGIPTIGRLSFDYRIDVSPLLDPRLLVRHIMFVVVPPIRLFPVATHSM